MHHGKVVVSLVILSGVRAWGACAVDPSLYHAERPVAVAKPGVKKAAPGKAPQPVAQGARILQPAERLTPEQRRYREMSDAVTRRDLRAFTGMLPADPGKRQHELAADDWLVTAARASALDIVRRILAWQPELAQRRPEARVRFTSALVDVVRSWREDQHKADEQHGPIAGPPLDDRIEALRYLLEWGADPNGWESGNPLVLMAGIRGSEHAARAADMLVQAGARNVEWNNTTPLRSAAELSSAFVVEALLRTPVPREALNDALVRTPVRSTNAVVGLLLAHGADLNTSLSLPGNGTMAEHQQPFPAVYLAVEAFQAEGDLTIVKQVLHEGADPNRPGHGTTPVDKAVHDPAVLRLLLDAGADPDRPDAGGLNALMKTRNGDDDSIRMLLDRGSTVRVDSVVWREGRRPRVPIGPVSWPLIHGNDSLAAAVVARQAPSSSDCGAAYYAAQSGASATLHALVRRGVSLTDVRDEQGLTPFMIAAKQGQLQTVRYFLDQGIARPDETLPRRPAIVGSGGHPSIPVLSLIGGESVLEIAREARQEEVVQELTRRGAQLRLR